MVAHFLIFLIKLKYFLCFIAFASLNTGAATDLLGK